MLKTAQLQEVSEDDKERYIEILKDIQEGIQNVNQQYKMVMRKVKQVDLNKGHPLLTLLTRELSSYISNVTTVMVAKVMGASLQQHAAVWQLVVSRTVIGKLWEVERKLQHELNKKASRDASATTADNPLNLKPDISNFDVQDDEGEDAEGFVKDDDVGGGGREDGDDNDDKSQIYKPSKQFPKFYDGDMGVGGRGGKRVGVKRSILNDLRSEFTDQPAEVYDGTGVSRMASRRKEEEKTQYEETHFVRLQPSKQDKLAAKRMSSMAYADVLNFGYSAADDDDGERKKKKKKNFRGKKKNKRFH